MIKFDFLDVVIVVAGTLLVSLGEINDAHGAIFAGAVWLGGFLFKVSQWWAERGKSR
jgi:hypothetical protein